MMFDMKQARDSNTISCWSKSIWRLFVDGKLFISESHKTCFESEEEAWKAFYDSFMWERISEYITYSQKFFDKEGDEEWRKEFERKVILRMGVELKEYTCNE